MIPLRVGVLAWPVTARRNVASWRSLVRSSGSVRGLRRRYLIEPRYMVEPHLRRIATPVTFVWGERDGFDVPDRRSPAGGGSGGGGPGGWCQRAF